MSKIVVYYVLDCDIKVKIVKSKLNILASL